MNSYIRLHPADNVVIALRNLNAGEQIVVEDVVISLHSDIRFGHKIAISAIAPRAKVIKYGLPIGSSGTAILPGEHVHVHNLTSDYKPH